MDGKVPELWRVGQFSGNDFKERERRGENKKEEGN